jgi:hypothetical protein
MDRIGTSTLNVSSESDLMESDAVSIPIESLCRRVLLTLSAGGVAAADGERHEWTHSIEQVDLNFERPACSV